MKITMDQNLLGKYTKRLHKESMLNALLLALAIGFGIAFVVAAVMWYVEINALWICLGVVACAVLLGLPILRMTAFKPSAKYSAKRIDRLGLDERTITMLELEGDDSLLSRLQREDACAHLAATDEKQMKIRISRKSIAWLCVNVVLACGMTTISVLAAMGYIMSGTEMLAPLLPQEPTQYVYIEYIAEMGGYIDGEEFQEIIIGQSGTEVTAVAEEGWIFAGWEDGGMQARRVEQGVQTSMLLVAIFEPVNEDGVGMPMPNDATPPDTPPNQNQNDGDSSEQNNPNSSGGGGKYAMANQTIDGKTYYGDVFDQYEEATDEYMSENEGKLSDDISDIVDAYYDILG